MTNNELNNIPGWFCTLDMSIFDHLLYAQAINNISGHLGEIGVYKGKSLLKLCQYAKPNEKVLGIDNCFNSAVIEEIYTNSNKFLPSFNNQNLVLKTGDSTKLNSSMLLNNTAYKNFRIFHIDGCHNAINTYSDIKLADDLLSNNGVIILDDFSDPIYVGVKEAFYTYTTQHPYSFKTFIASTTKCYACRPEYYYLYMKYADDLYNYLLNNYSELDKYSIIKSYNLLNGQQITILDKTTDIHDIESTVYSVIKY